MKFLIVFSPFLFRKVFAVECYCRRVLQMLRFANAYADIQESLYRYWTFFVPLDGAFERLSSYKQRQLRTDETVAKEYVK